MSTICLLGRQPAIGLAELESLYGADSVTPVGAQAALVETPIDFNRLGGTVKAATHLTTLKTSNPQNVFDYCRRVLPEHLQYIPEGKIKLGVSLYGFDMPVATINTNTLTLKKVIKKAGRSVRAVPNTDTALSSAQTYHNGLTSPVGLELVLVRHGNSTVLGQVTHVQDIDSYTLRDRGRPQRDAFVGMLPPKLAQTIINLAVGPSNQTEDDRPKTEEASKRDNSNVSPNHSPVSNLQPPATSLQPPATSHQPPVSSLQSLASNLQPPASTIVDPFCGTGVILQEAALMGYDVYGTDVSPKMIDYSRANLEWLMKKYEIGNRKYGRVTFEVADATKHAWDISSRFPLPGSLAVATETFLGQPLGGQHPTPEKLTEIMHECNAILRGFLTNIVPQIPTGTRLCIAAPAWFVDNSYHHLACITDLESLGYSRCSFDHATDDDLIYRRDDQPTGRELLVLTKS